MRPLPVSLDLKNRDCLVVGASEDAIQCSKKLILTGARVTLIDTQNSVALEGLHRSEVREFKPEDLNNFWVIIAASDNETTNATIAELCHSRQKFCLNTSNPADSSFQLPTDAYLSALSASTTSPQSSESNSNAGGFVSLVGAGPGDPELLTIKAIGLIKSADVLVYDRLVSQSILDLHHPNARLIYAGKAKSDHTMPQGSINQLLVNLAIDGLKVVRLKGGDPFIFGRGGEEIETLAENNIPFQVVPGITAASGCSAYSGIPLTHRDHAQSCVFVTGHLKNGEINLNWQDLKDPTQTIVIYMGLTGLRQICEKLIDNGRSPDTPAAMVERGTTPDQRIHQGTLTTLADEVDKKGVRAPTLLIIGSVVALHDKLHWFKPD